MLVGCKLAGFLTEGTDCAELDALACEEGRLKPILELVDVAKGTFPKTLLAVELPDPVLVTELLTPPKVLLLELLSPNTLPEMENPASDFVGNRPSVFVAADVDEDGVGSEDVAEGTRDAELKLNPDEACERLPLLAPLIKPVKLLPDAEVGRAVDVLAPANGSVGACGALAEEARLAKLNPEEAGGLATLPAGELLLLGRLKLKVAEDLAESAAEGSSWNRDFLTLLPIFGVAVGGFGGVAKAVAAPPPPATD